jgi:hypothetical protein
MKKAKRGFHGYPLATVIYYGPDDRRATKAVVGIVAAEGAEVDPLERWLVEAGDIRHDKPVHEAMLAFIQRNQARSVVMTDGIFGCPHEEAKDYPEGEACPQCPFWANRPRHVRRVDEGGKR